MNLKQLWPKIKKILKMMGITLGAIIILTLLVITLFLNLSPQFGKGSNKNQKNEYKKSGHFEEGKFVNRIPAVMNINYGDLVKNWIQGSPNRQPNQNIIVDKIDSLSIENHNPNISKLTWFGHSAFLLEMDGLKILIDPMFGDTPSPHPWLGSKRYSIELPIEIEKLPFIDFVIFSHDHYDHLDYESVQKLKDKVGSFYVPLGLGNHLISWGVSKERIHELNWWETINFEHIELVCTPARHFSGRGLFDRASTLWCSWVIQGESTKIFFSGDSGYDIHFKEIGDKYGPFDISLMECGQYNEDWKAIHMMPEETVQAAIDLNSKLMLPIHWGAFTLAFHDWNEPAERVTKKADELNIPITTPKIGEPVIIGNQDYPEGKWWNDYTVSK